MLQMCRIAMQGSRAASHRERGEREESRRGYRRHESQLIYGGVLVHGVVSHTYYWGILVHGGVSHTYYWGILVHGGVSHTYYGRVLVQGEVSHMYCDMKPRPGRGVLPWSYDMEHGLLVGIPSSSRSWTESPLAERKAWYLRIAYLCG